MILYASESNRHMWIATVSKADWKKEKPFIISSGDFDVPGTKTV